MAYEQFANGGISSLATAMTDTVGTSLTVKSAVGFPTVGNFRIIVGTEIMIVTAVQGKTFTVTRGAEGSTAATHSADDAVFHTLTAGSLAQRDIEQFNTGLITARDSPGQAGRIYVPTEGLVAQDNGSLWDMMPMNRMAPPSAGDFTWVNQGGSTAADSKGMMLFTTATSASDGLRLLVKAQPATPYTITTCMFAQSGTYITSQSIPQYGICWRDSSSGKILTYGPGMANYYGAFAYAQWTNYTTVSAGQFMYSVPFAGPIWIRFADDGSNRTVSVSFDGYKYELVSPVAGPHRVPDRRSSRRLLQQWKEYEFHSARPQRPTLESSIMAESFKNLASTTLNGNHNDTITSISVASAMGFTTGDFRILIDSEIMKVTGVSGTTLTVARHQEGTQAASHTNGTAVYHVLTAGALDAHDQNDLAVYDTYANKPAAGTPGRIFLPTDGIFIERDNGATWDKFGPIWPMTPPASTDFPTWVNQGTASCIDNKGAIFFSVPQSGSSTPALVLRMKTYPTPPFTVETAFIGNIHPMGASQIAIGLAIRDSVGGKIQTYGPGGEMYQMELIGYNYNSVSSGAGAITGWPSAQHYTDQPITWLKYYDSGAARVISLSVDGYNWSQIVSLAVADTLTPNQIGIVLNAATGYSSSWGTADTGMTLLHWKQY